MASEAETFRSLVFIEEDASNGLSVEALRDIEKAPNSAVFFKSKGEVGDPSFYFKNGLNLGEVSGSFSSIRLNFFRSYLRFTFTGALSPAEGFKALTLPIYGNFLLALYTKPFLTLDV